MRGVGLVVALTAAGMVAAGLAATEQPFGAGRAAPRLPQTISPEARAYIQHLMPFAAGVVTEDNLAAIARRRAEEAKGITQAALASPVVRRFQPVLSRRTIAGVPVLEIVPAGAETSGKVLIYLHGGGYVFGSAEQGLDQSVPLVSQVRLRTLSIDYTTAPAARWPEVTEQVARVLRTLVAEGTALSDMALFGESAGAGLAAAATLKLRDEGLGQPAALLLMSPWADLTAAGDTYATLEGADPRLRAADVRRLADLYADAADQSHPYVSPVNGDFAGGFPPTLIQAGTREIFLSDAVRLYQAMADGGANARLDVYEGMPHVFQERWDLPESRKALSRGAAFLRAALLPTPRREVTP